MRRSLLERLRDRRVVVAVQLVVLAVVVAAVGFAFHGAWADASPRLRDANLVDLGVAVGILVGSYLLFVVGWRWILAALGIPVSYAAAFESEMASMAAKYVPGGLWTPLARVVWFRRITGIDRTTTVVSSILLEAGLAAVAGVLVLLVGCVWVHISGLLLVPLAVFAVAIAALVHPRGYWAVVRRAFRRLGVTEPAVLPLRTAVAALGLYTIWWLVGGLVLYFMIRSVGSDPGLATVPYLGGTAAVGGIVSVLSVLAPAGLGVRDGSMYGFILAVAPNGAALGAVVLSRLAMTVVEALLIGFAVAVARSRGRASAQR